VKTQRHTGERHAPNKYWAASHRHWPRWIRVTRLNWYRKRQIIRSNRHAWRVYRTLVGAIGGLIIVFGLITVPLPGPGWLTVFIGLAILGTEFHWARRLLHRSGVLFRTWRDWLMRQHMPVRIVVSVLTCLFVCAIVYLILKWLGLPDWTPEAVVPPWLGIPVNDG